MSLKGRQNHLKSPCKTIAQVQMRHDPNQITQLSIIHSAIESMQGIQKLRYLKVCDLRCNNLYKIEGLHNLMNLTKLDISTNFISSLEGLSGLTSLQILIATNNKITSLAGLNELVGSPKLKSLWLFGNYLSKIEQMQILTKFPALEQVKFEYGKNTNPFCSDEKTYLEACRQLQSVGKPKKIDNRLLNQVEKLLIQKTSTVVMVPKENTNNSNLTMTPYPQQHVQPISAPKYSQSIQLRQAQRMLNYKEKIISTMEDKIVKMQEQAHKSYRQLTKKEQQVERLHTQIVQIEQKYQQKDKQMKELQKQISQHIRDNSALNKEISLKNNEIEKHINITSQLRLELSECRAVLKDTDRRLMQVNNKLLDNANTNTQKTQEIRRKYETAIQQLKSCSRDNTQMKQRISELNELIREWQYKYERKMSEIQHEHESDKNNMIRQFESRVQQLEAYYGQNEAARMHDYKQQLNAVEDQYNKALEELGQRYKTCKASLDEKRLQDQENRQILKATLQKNTDQEHLIQQLQASLLKFRQQVVEIVKQKQAMSTELYTFKNSKSSQVRQLQQERDRLIHQKNYIQHQLQDYKEKLNLANIEKQKMHDRAKSSDELEQRVQQLTHTIDMQNHLINDKTETIQNMKSQHDGLRQEIEFKKDEVAEIRKKYEKSKQNAKDQQSELQSCLTENAELQQTIGSLESELSALKDKLQQKEENQGKIQKFLDDFEQKIKEKDSQIFQLLNLLEECKKVNTQKNEQVEHVRREGDRIRRQLEDRIQFQRGREKVLKAQADNMKQRLAMLERERKQAQQESQRVKREAKESLQKISRMFV